MKDLFQDLCIHSDAGVLHPVFDTPACFGKGFHGDDLLFIVAAVFTAGIDGIARQVEQATVNCLRIEAKGLQPAAELDLQRDVRSATLLL